MDNNDRVSSSVPDLLGLSAVGNVALNPRRLLLYGALTQAELLTTVRTRCAEPDVSSLPTLMEAWRAASEEFQTLIRQGSPRPDEVQTAELGEASKPVVESLLADPLFRSTFSHHQYSFKLVEIDKLVAGQREVDLDHVERLVPEYGSDLGEGKLAEICLSPRAALSVPAFQQLTPNAIVYSSQHPGLRFLHGFPKAILAEGDMNLALAGGQPVAAVVLFVGYGANPVNVYSVGGRLVLNNGFHRAYALRRAGAKFMPAVVQAVANPDLEMPPTIAGVPKEYVLNHTRPAMVGDFFHPGLTGVVRIKPTIKHVKLQWGWEEYPGPAVPPATN